ncbi:MAG TPA: hypothetical protein DHV39_02680, partial [Verrucomicrobiales bacterium]|nr:hypothetical protein [Verrucomicrobiales bacterium]
MTVMPAQISIACQDSIPDVRYGGLMVNGLATSWWKQDRPFPNLIAKLNYRWYPVIHEFSRAPFASKQNAIHLAPEGSNDFFSGRLICLEFLSCRFSPRPMDNLQ